jgi:hypothetical protein
MWWTTLETARKLPKCVFRVGVWGQDKADTTGVGRFSPDEADWQGLHCPIRTADALIDGPIGVAPAELRVVEGGLDGCVRGPTSCLDAHPDEPEPRPLQAEPVIQGAAVA